MAYADARDSPDKGKRGGIQANFPYRPRNNRDSHSKWQDFQDRNEVCRRPYERDARGRAGLDTRLRSCATFPRLLSQGARSSRSDTRPVQRKVRTTHHVGNFGRVSRLVSDSIYKVEIRDRGYVRQGCCLLIPVPGQPVCVAWRCGKRTTQAIRAGTARSIVYGAVSCRSESSERSCPRQVRLHDSRQRGRIRSCIADLSGNGPRIFGRIV